MVSSTATTVDQYLASLPADRRAALAAVRATINANLPDGYQEGMQFGMIGWCIPLATYSNTYNGQPLGLAALASQKNYMALYLMSVYGDPELDAWFKAAFAARGKKLDMGKSCVRFKSLDALPLDVIGETITKVSVAKYLSAYEAVKGSPRLQKTANPTKAAKPAKPAKPAKTKSAKSKPAKTKSAKSKPAKPAKPAKAAKTAKAKPAKFAKAAAKPKKAKKAAKSSPAKSKRPVKRRTK